MTNEYTSGSLPSLLAILLAGLVVLGLVGMADAQTWAPLTTSPPVSFGAMMLLTDGRVLLHEEPNCGSPQPPGCVGNDYTAWYTLTPDINGSYTSGTWTQVASLPGGYAPLFFASAVLPDGKVIVQGGEYQNGSDAWQSLGALYDPVANTWTATTPPIASANQAFGDAESVVLPNGTWMVAACCAEGRGSSIPQYYYFNEGTLDFTSEASGSDGVTSEFDESGWNLLPNGKVLMVDAYLDSYGSGTGRNSEIYDPSTNTWSSAGDTQVQLWDNGCGNAPGPDPGDASLELGPGILMPNGTVFYTGGSNCHAGYTATYDWSTGVWTGLSQFPNNDAANDAPASIEINGKAIVMTSPFTNTFSPPSTFYEWDGSTLSTFPNPSHASSDDSYQGHLLVLPTGQILFTDFFTTGVAILTSAGTYQAAWQPTITTSPSELIQGTTYSVSGTQFNGVATGASYGDDFQDNTNYPLVRIVNNSSTHVFYARTHGHSTMGVATGSTPVSTSFDVPLGAETGPCELYVVANGIPSAAASCNVEPAGTPTITSANNTTFVTSTLSSFTVTTTGSPTPSIGVSGALPSGITFHDNGNGTGTLGGTPGPNTGGIYPLTFTAHNGTGPDAVQSFTLTVDQPPAITSANSTTFTTSIFSSFTVTTTGFPTPSIGATGSLPTGVSFHDNGDGTASLAGTPAPGTGGIYPLTITAMNGIGSPAMQSFTLTVDQPPAITSASSATFTIGVYSSFTVTATGFPTPSIKQSGHLPNGITFKDNGNGTGTLSGTPPRVFDGGDFSITFTATNGIGSPAVQPFTIILYQAPAFTSANNATFEYGVPNSFTVTTTGFPAPSITESGTLPPWLTFVDNGNGTATLSGTPAYSSGTFALVLSGTNVVTTNQQNFTLTVSGLGLTPSPLSFGFAYLNSSHTLPLTVTNEGSSPVTVSGVTVTPGSNANAATYKAVNHCTAALKSGKSCTIDVTFLANATGTLTATLNITDNALGSPQQVALTGNGIDPVAKFSPTKLAFGTEALGSSTTLPVQLTNSGLTPLIISNIGVTGAGDFTEVNNCPAILSAGMSCTISVTFAPTAKGAKTGTVTVTDNVAAGQSTVALTGTGK
jgi:hypothetical protein